MYLLRRLIWPSLLIFALAACSDDTGSNNSDDDPNDTGTQDASVDTDTTSDDTGADDAGDSEDTEDTGDADGTDPDSFDDADTGGGDGPSFDQFTTDLPTTYIEALCRSAFQCPEGQRPNDTRSVFGRFTSQADCEANLPERFVPVDIPDQDDLNDGLATYDPAVAQQCLDELEQILAGDACALALDAAPRVESCFKAFSGTVAEGEPCLKDIQCASRDCGPGPECYGECRAAGDEGETCGTQDVRGCKPWLTCQWDADGNELCVQFGSSAAGEPCRSDSGCTGSTDCDSEESPRVCDNVTMKTAGEECTDRNFCAAGTACVGAGGFNDGTCGDPRAVGEGCSEDDECQWGLFCDDATGECAERRSEGASCESSSECEFGLKCDILGLSTCEPRDSEPCSLP